VALLTYLLAGILVMIALWLLGRLLVDSFRKWAGAQRRADELLRAVLTSEEYGQLRQQGYLDIPSPSNPQRIYRVPQTPGLVRVREKERRKGSLCLQPLDWVPDADVVVIHKLMIEADEETYLQMANSIPPISRGGWID
jgi:hypothetical protein